MKKVSPLDPPSKTLTGFADGVADATGTGFADGVADATGTGFAVGIVPKGERMDGQWTIFSRGGGWGGALGVAALVVWAASVAAVAWMSLLPDVDMPGEFPGVDKLYHLVGYGWLAFWPCFGFSRKRVGLAASLSMILLGCGLEYAQGHVPGRMASTWDMVANTAGVVLGILAGRLARLRFMPAFRRVIF